MFSSLSRYHRAGLLLFALVFLAFGVVVEVRSAFLSRPMTDLQVYLRAAWAVRTGADVYTIADENDWHFHYPTIFAIALVPMADAPPGFDRAGLAPFGVSVALWYALGVLCLFLAAHWLASALEETSADPAVRGQPSGCRRWWALRLIPVLACLPPAMQTLTRGQVNTLVLAMLCAMTAAALRGRSWRAGLWLSAAVCVKIIPAFLLLYPLWRRDWRWLAGSALGLVVGLAAVPMAVFGPEKTWAYTQEWGDVLLRPALRREGDSTRAKELIEATATDSQSPLRLIHFALYPKLETRPPDAAPWVRRAHWLIGAALVLATLWSAGRRPPDGARLAVFQGSLIVVMLMLSPVCHQHYLCLLLPLVMGLVAGAWESQQVPRLGTGLGALLLAFPVATCLPFLPGLGFLRDHGLPGIMALVVWLAGCLRLRREAPQVQAPVSATRAAA